jgi:Flp pilus assembly protein TadD
MPTSVAAEAERLCELAQQHLGQNEFDMAEDMFREAVQTDPTYYAARLNLGILLQRRSRHAEAIGEYQAVLALKPDNVTAWRNLALAYMTTKDYAKARVTLQKLQAVEMDNPQTWIDLGDVEMLMGRSQTARQCWEKARTLSKPSSETAVRAGKRLGVYGR